MFAYWKGRIPSGTKSEVPVTNIDFFSTILDVAGIIPPAWKILDGKSILPVLTRNGSIDERPLFWHFPIYIEGGNKESQDTIFRTRPGSSVSLDNWKLIQYFENNDLELCNLKEDIGEKNNLAKSNPDKTKELLNLLTNLRKDTHAPVPTELNPNLLLNKTSKRFIRTINQIEGVYIQSEIVFLEVTVKEGDICRFEYSLDNKKFRAIGNPYVASPGVWIGAKVGLFCINPNMAESNGYANFDWFRVE